MDFNFEIGDRVYVKVAVDDVLLALKMGERTLPNTFLVTKRVYDECPGGVQRHYEISRDGRAFMVHEIEIMHSDALDLQPVIDLYAKIRQKREASQERS